MHVYVNRILCVGDLEAHLKMLIAFFQYPWGLVLILKGFRILGEKRYNFLLKFPVLT